MDQNSNSIMMKGAKKAALFLMSLGKEEAAKVMAHLDDKMIEEIIQEMSKIRSVSKVEKEAILNEFKSTLEDKNPVESGGIETAKEILEKSVGNHKATEILKKINKKDIVNEFEFLNDVEPKVIYSLISNEAPQTIAITLAYVSPKTAAEVIKLLPTEQRAQIALKLATTSKTNQEAVFEIAKILKKRYETRDNNELSDAGGAQSLANILNHLDKDIEDGILQNLTTESPDIANQVKEKLYSFEDILNLDPKEMRTLLSKITNDVLAFGLR
ncbi:MAG: flagellar motor switch protein FliG, partial [Leptospiraceae bacterium]|nr:flagellar motor switch protein FliG [Leptospiraceae bacterium]